MEGIGGFVTAGAGDGSGCTSIGFAAGTSKMSLHVWQRAFLPANRSGNSKQAWHPGQEKGIGMVDVLYSQLRLVVGALERE
jgi:hypothetical protein